VTNPSDWQEGKVRARLRNPWVKTTVIARANSSARSWSCASPAAASWAHGLPSHPNALRVCGSETAGYHELASSLGVYTAGRKELAL